MLEPGKPAPLGAHWDGSGINFAIYAAGAERLTLCLFEENDNVESRRVDLPCQTDGVWHGYLPGAGPGIVYGYRAAGTYSPEQGLWFNDNKLLLDPYARDVTGPVVWHESHCAGTRDHPDPRDNAPYMAKARVAVDDYAWQNDRAPAIALADTIVYELHIKGFTMRNPRVPAEHRGRFSGLAHPSSIFYLRQLGVTAVELMPVHLFSDEAMLVPHGLSNYWGYNTVNFFTPDPRYGSVDDFRDMVTALHRAGIEVFLDVVYNHTAESDELGPMYNLRGLDNPAYYRLLADYPGLYKNDAGCGNTLNVCHPRALELVLDSLRYWVRDMHVDGFRFDLATTLARDPDDFSPDSPLFTTISEDPVLANVKLIAEPWDIGDGGYRLGQFPRRWSEWNDKYRSGIRQFWLRREASRGEFAQRLTASADIFQQQERAPTATVNYVASHDGFTLADLTSYDHKHNERNLQDGADGSNDNRSWNCGIEGPSRDPVIRELRKRLQRNLLTTLFLSNGIPMIHAGDEFGRSQHGNNNAYCQDNELSWLDWQRADMTLHQFVRRLIDLRKRFPHFRRASWSEDLTYELSWQQADGSLLSEDDWNRHDDRRLTVHYKHVAGTDVDFLLLINGNDVDAHFVLPEGDPWGLLLDTTGADNPARCTIDTGGYLATGLSAVLFQRQSVRDEPETDALTS